MTLIKSLRFFQKTFGLNIEGRVRTIKQVPNGDIIVLIE